MQSEIHPAYGPVQVTCSCGHTFTMQSTLGQEAYKVDVCDHCHPYYTGKHKILDTEGRVDKFMRRYGMTAKDDQSATNDGDE